MIGNSQGKEGGQSLEHPAYVDHLHIPPSPHVARLHRITIGWHTGASRDGHWLAHWCLEDDQKAR